MDSGFPHLLDDEATDRFARDLAAAAGWRVLHVAPAEFSNTVAAPTPAIVVCLERT